MNHRLLKLISAVFLFAGFLTFTQAEGVKDGNRVPLRKTDGLPANTLFNINNISTIFYSDGQSDLNLQGNSGFFFPKGSGKAAVFQTGFVWGGMVDGKVRVGGVTYNSGIQPGNVVGMGAAAKAVDPESDRARMYRVRPDYRTGSMTSEVRDGEGAEADIRAQYEKDWMEWPADLGAPYNDVNGDGKYDPAVDIPGVPGAHQTIWSVANDFDQTKAQGLYGSPSIGLELQTTVWGYSSAGALGNMLFRKYKLINKGTSNITQMYVSNWSDPDNGDAGDDFAGCDTTLSLAYCYNATLPDKVYGNEAPAVGFDFFQGPMVKGAATDTAIFDGKKVAGYKNLPMTAFYYFINSDAVMTDPTLGSNYERGTLRFWNLLQGKIGTTGEYFPVPTGGLTKFPLSGDPVAGTGYLDGKLFAKGDRRIGSASGPFDMKAGDVQEIVVAEIAAGGPGSGMNNIQAVSLLKGYDKVAQKAYDDFFVLPSAPEPPKVKVAAMDRSVVLNWGWDENTVVKTESHDAKGFTFEGYNVYQLPSKSASAKEGVKVATYDLVNDVKIILGDVLDPGTGTSLKAVQQVGSDNGIQRYLKIENDYLTNTKLVNGKKYYFAVTAYAFTPDPLAVPNNLENPLDIIEVVTHAPDPGVRYNSQPGDSLLVTRTGGKSDGQVIAYVVDPSAVNGHKYNVSFANVGGEFLWSVKDVTTGEVKLNNQAYQASAEHPQDGNFIIVDGIMIKVFGPPTGMKDWDYTGTRAWTWAGGTGFGLEGYEGTIGMAYDHWFSGSSVTPDKLADVEIRFATTDAKGVVTNPNEENVSAGYRFLRGATAAAAKPEFAPFIINKTAGYAFQDFKKNIPFSAWNVETGKRLSVGYLENNSAGGRVDGVYFPQTNTDAGADNYASSGPREWFYVFDVPYSETVNPELQKDILNVKVPIMWWGTPTRRNGYIFKTGDTFKIFANHVNAATDAWEFTSKTVTVSEELAKEDVEKINVFPNPYYAVNPQELNKYQKFVTFSHLPADATIRIFNLAGQLIRTINKESADQYQRWDLNNVDGLPVASGLYIVHIDMPKIGKTKVLKVAVIQEQQILDRF